MEDLYKILPLTVDTVFNQDALSIVCVFDTAQDVLTSEQILTMVWQQKNGKYITPTKTQVKACAAGGESFIQKLMNAICCRKPA